MALDSRNRLLVCERGRLTRTEADGKLTILVDSFEGKGLHSPHDVAVRSDRTVFFTDLKPEKEWANPAKVGFSGVYELRSTGEMFLFPREYAGPNGIALSPDEDRLYVAERVKPNENVTRPDLGCAI
ncbi:MAG TPA: SMP-30/gluconolactonase/LRE family protein [Bryobacteraceae bacterium]|nr:SMP-30/gluconolactonase/LRE family protein [Bryobacteraceae bacterium]